MSFVERHSSAEFVNQIVNHPSVYPWICGPLTSPLDLSEPIRSGNYIALMGEHGGFLFWHVKNGIYDAHSAVLPSGRGRWALNAANEAAQWMFDRESAQEIMGVAPKGNIAVRALMRALGASCRGKLSHGWYLAERGYVDCEVYSLTKKDFERCRSLHH